MKAINKKLSVLSGTLAVGITAGILGGGCATATEKAPKAITSPAISASQYGKPGFHTELDKDGRLWVFNNPSPELDEFKTKGKPARHVVRPGAGPEGLTMKSAEMNHIVEYLVSRPGFHTELDKDGRLWVFKKPSPELDEFKTKGKPARHVVRPAAGPLGLTIKSTDLEILDSYLQAR